MSVTTALKARREQLRDREAGFTLIELLVVVIIIGILAAIAIPVYIGVQNNAKNSSVQSDLTNAKTAYVAYVAAQSAGTTTITDLGNYGYAASSYTSPGVAPAIKAGATTTAFCINATSNSGTAYFIKNDTAVTAGTC